jgi:hypothetical protein
MGILKKIIDSFMKLYNLKISPSIVNHEKFLGKKTNSLNIYGGSAENSLFTPFNISFIHINRLILVSFEEDTLFNGIELQVLHHNNKDYPVVILFKKDESQDVYYINRETMKLHEEHTQKLLSNPTFNFIETIDYNFEVDDKGLSASLLMIEKNGYNIEFKIREKLSRRELSAILAPIGASTPNPQYFPYIFLDQFGLVIKEHTYIQVKINGILKRIPEFPVRVNGNRVYMVRFSLNPILAYWNNSYKGKLYPINITDNLKIRNHDLEHEFIQNENFLEIKKISKRDDVGHELSIEFSPPIPHLVALKTGFKVIGRFSSGIDNVMGIVVGMYEIMRKANLITITIKPSKAWQPFPGKKWVSFYKWIAKLEINAKNEVDIDSKWENANVMTSKEFTESTTK